MSSSGPSRGVSFETARVFIALNLDVASVRRAADVARRLKASPLAAPASWVSPTKMHVTLKFLGDIDVGLTPALADALKPLAEGVQAIPLVAERLDAFPSVSSARVLFLGIDDPTGRLAELVAEVESRCEGLGFPREPRPHHAHLTLARPRAPLDARAWLTSESAKGVGECVATELVLYRSDTARGIEEYEALMRVEYMFERIARKSEGPPRRRASSRAPASGGAPPVIPPPPKLPR